MMTDKMINIVLDLDETLINSVPKKRFGFTHARRAMWFDYKTMSQSYVVFGRPGLQAFLDWLFTNFTVSVWTAATQLYAQFVTRHFILNNDPRRHVKYIFFSKHCEYSQRHTGNHKDLKILWRHFPEQYTPTNTIIIDNREDVAEVNRGNSIQIRPFYFSATKSWQDDVLQTEIKPTILAML